MSKTILKQFFTHGYEVLQPFITAYLPAHDCIVDPYAGQQHLLKLFTNERTHAIDIDPDVEPDRVADSFTALQPIPNCVVVTNPPYSHRHVLQKQDPTLYATVTAAGYTDLYEYAIRRVLDQLDFPPTFALLPENFIASRTTVLRRELYQHIHAIQIHTTSTCHDTDQPTVMALLARPTIQHTDLWLDDQRMGTIKIEPEGFRPDIVAPHNHVDFGMKDNQSIECRDTSILLQATDGGSYQNRIKLMRVYERFPGRHFHNKISDRAYIQIVPHFELAEEEIAILIQEFNRWIDDWRKTTHGLGLTSFRSNTANGFRRKRLDFNLARLVVNHIIARKIAPVPTP